MQLKNKTQREEFLEKYRNWELWKEIPEIEVKLYRHKFENGTGIIATEYASMRFAGWEKGSSYYEKGTDVNYHLILAEGDSFKTEYRHANKFYSPSGDGKSTIIKYLTETRPEVQI